MIAPCRFTSFIARPVETMRRFSCAPVSGKARPVRSVVPKSLRRSFRSSPLQMPTPNPGRPAQENPVLAACVGQENRTRTEQCFTLTDGLRQTEVWCLVETLRTDIDDVDFSQ